AYCADPGVARRYFARSNLSKNKHGQGVPVPQGRAEEVQSGELGTAALLAMSPGKRWLFSFGASRSGLFMLSRFDLEVANFRQQFQGRGLRDPLVRRGAQRMLQQVIGA